MSDLFSLLWRVTVFMNWVLYLKRYQRTEDCVDTYASRTSNCPIFCYGTLLSVDDVPVCTIYAHLEHISIGLLHVICLVSGFCNQQSLLIRFSPFLQTSWVGPKQWHTMFAGCLHKLQCILIPNLIWIAYGKLMLSTNDFVSLCLIWVTQMNRGYSKSCIVHWTENVVVNALRFSIFTF